MSANKEVRLKTFRLFTKKQDNIHLKTIQCILLKNPTWTCAIPKPDNSTTSPATYEQF